jgi:eukaryotic-like serine/threonine-protein kinase
MSNERRPKELEFPVKPGDTVAGKFLVTEYIAVGGMGIVYGATHLELETPVALKFVRPEFAAEEDLVLRFLNEARSAAQLKSEHVARVMDCGRLPSGIPYLVMERLEGSDLATTLRRIGPLPIEVATDYVLQACQALDEAHAALIVHRDIKPENLFLTRRPDGSPLIKILDFGISKQLRHSTEQRALTLAGQGSLGSPSYMSPEQMKTPHDVDARSDIWSIGIVLYELLTGTAPFEAQTVAQTCARVLTMPMPSLRQVRPDVPPQLEAIVSRCLEKERTLRFASIQELVLALQPFSSTAADAPTLRVTPVEAEAVRRAAQSSTDDALDGVSRTRSSVPEVVVHPVREPKRTRPLVTIFALGVAFALGLLGLDRMGYDLTRAAAGAVVPPTLLPDDPELTEGWMTRPSVAPSADLIVPPRGVRATEPREPPEPRLARRPRGALPDTPRRNAPPVPPLAPTQSHWDLRK